MNRKIIAYKLQPGNDSEELEENVALSLEEGWQPFGGIAYATYKGEDGVRKEWYEQAMVRYEEPSPS